MRTYDVVVIGGGPGGLAAAAAARRSGADRVLLLEREAEVGGILNQCIHDGFGLHRYREQLSGPEYAQRCAQEARDAGVEIRTGHMVRHIGADRTVTAVSREGFTRISAGALVLSTGCRERTRGMIAIPGTRPAGVLTAGVAQNFINERNLMVGKRVVILGSGDIGLIMARRLRLEGAQVLAVVELMPDSGGLTRNISQCLYDFDIPLYLGHTVSRIFGKKRVEGVEIARVDAAGRIVSESAWTLDCDTLILSVGLIPENELAKDMGARLDAKTNGVQTDAYLQTSIPGVFACGNARRVMDLADYVSAQGEAAGENAARFARGEAMKPWDETSATRMRKGVPEPGSVICTLCPNGCAVQLDEKGEASGNRCARGAAFAKREREAPERILTTTVRVEGADVPLVPVRSDGPVKRSELLTLVAQLRQKSVKAPVSAGQVLFEGIGENKVGIVAQRGVERRG